MTDAKQPLIVVGAGGFGREAIELVRALQMAGRSIEMLGVCDDDPSLHGHDVLGVPVIGPIDAVHGHPESQIVVTIGNPSRFDVRKRIVDDLGLAADRYATLVHPAAVVPDSARVGAGSVIHAHCVLTADVTVGSHVVMMPSVVLTHDDRVGDFVTIGAGALVAGRVTIGEGAYIGSGAMVREHLTVGEWSLIGMGSVVTGNIPSREIWAGSPARFMRAARP
jgi:sugar O-acyltransferase (sialic acid O-acetyltransferase NeuD family)